MHLIYNACKQIIIINMFGKCMYSCILSESLFHAVYIMYVSLQSLFDVGMYITWGSMQFNVKYMQVLCMYEHSVFNACCCDKNKKNEMR